MKPRESWPPLDGGLEMELVETKNGVNSFRFVWGPSMKEAQKHFFVCVQTGDPNTIAMVRSLSRSRRPSPDPLGARAAVA